MGRLAATAPTALGRAQATQESQSPEARRAASVLGIALSGGVGRVLRDLVIPGVGPAKVRLLDHQEEQEVNLELAVWAAGIERAGASLGQLAAIGGMSATAERAVRTLARAIRDPADPEKPFGAVEEWARLGHQAIGVANNAYEDLLEELDPLGAGADPTEAEMAEIRAALKKKDRVLLSTFGVRKLVAFMTASGDPPESSETPT